MPKMRTRAKMKAVASDRARRENMPRHIPFLHTCESEDKKQAFFKKSLAKCGIS